MPTPSSSRARMVLNSPLKPYVHFWTPYCSPASTPWSRRECRDRKIERIFLLAIPVRSPRMIIHMAKLPQ